MKNRLIFLGIYGALIIVLLVLILFVIPDSVFRKKYEENFYKVMGEQTNYETEQAKTQYIDYKEQQERLKKNNYTYSYQILTPASKDLNIIYNCKGSIKDGKESGTCTKPRAITYDEKTKKSELKRVNMNYIDPSYIFKILNEYVVEPIDYTGFRIYTYNIKLNGIKTEVQVATDKENIAQIEINNSQETYVLKYSDITY